MLLEHPELFAGLAPAPNFDIAADRVMTALQGQPNSPEKVRAANMVFERLWEKYKTQPGAARLRLVWIDDNTLTVIDINQLED